MKNKKFASILIGASLSILVFAGCGSTKAPTDMKPPINKQIPPTNKSINNNANSQIPKANSTANSTAMMKTLYSDTIKELVTAKMITKTQSQKVLEQLTKDISQNTRTSTNMNKLSVLVKSHVITQEQADKINQKIMNAMNKVQ